MKGLVLFFRLFSVCVLLAGCAGFPVNPPLEKYDKDVGYRFNNLSSPNNSDSLFVMLAFSGGGTRAAALSYGVLKKLRQIEIQWEGSMRSLLDEVDVISSVSGGSFTSAYYALYGSDTFKSFPERFLYKNIQRELTMRLFYPLNWIRLLFPSYSRIDMAAEFYNTDIFGEKTYEDLVSESKRPYIIVNATDISIGAPFGFVQDQFDLICSDLSGVPVARAVAASSCFPVAFSPMTIKNHAGECDFVQPPWVDQALKDSQLNPPRYQRARTVRSYYETLSRPYIHLLDGGVADNIGLRELLVALRSNDLSWSIQNRINLGEIKKVLVIVVDAKTKADMDEDKSASAPGLVSVLNKIATVPLDNYSFDTVEMLRETFDNWKSSQQAYDDCKAELKEKCPGQKMSFDPPSQVELFPVYVGFNQIKNPERQNYFLSMATSFYLPDEQVTDLINVAGEILDQSDTFNELVNEISVKTDGH